MGHGTQSRAESVLSQAVVAVSEPSPSAIDAAIDALRGQLRARYGWAWLEGEVSVSSGRRMVAVSAEVVSPRVEGALRAAIEAQIPSGWCVELELRTLPVERWVGVPSEGLAIWAEHFTAARRSLATELEPDDGPVGVVAEDGRAKLVRARDGTLGWTEATLDEAASARPLAEPRTNEDALGSAIYAHARTYLGIPYRLGGATRRHIDCSALVQRALFAALGVLVPRNTRDQLAAAGGGRVEREHAPEPGDLLYIHSRRMQRLHVGIVGPEAAILHASRTRDAVIEEPLEAFERDATWTRHVGWIHLREWARTQAGRAHLQLPAPIRLDP